MNNVRAAAVKLALPFALVISTSQVLAQRMRGIAPNQEYLAADCDSPFMKRLMEAKMTADMTDNIWILNVMQRVPPFGGTCELHAWQTFMRYLERAYAKDALGQQVPVAEDATDALKIEHALEIAEGSASTLAQGKWALTRSLSIEPRQASDPMPDALQEMLPQLEQRSPSTWKDGLDVAVGLTLTNKANYTIQWPESARLFISNPAGPEPVWLGCQGHSAAFHSRFSPHNQIAPGKRLTVLCRFPNMFEGGKKVVFWISDEAGMKLLDQLRVPGKWSVDPGFLTPVAVMETDSSELRAEGFIEASSCEDRMNCKNERQSSANWNWITGRMVFYGALFVLCIVVAGFRKFMKD